MLIEAGKKEGEGRESKDRKEEQEKVKEGKYKNGEKRRERGEKRKEGLEKGRERKKWGGGGRGKRKIKNGAEQ